MDIRAHVVALSDTRMKVWEEAKALLDDAQRVHPSQEMTGEERAKWDRLNARIDDIDQEIRSFEDRETREREAAIARESFERQYGTTAADQRASKEVDEFRAWARGEIRRTDDYESRNNAFGVNLRAAQAQAEAIRAGAGPEELRSLLSDTGSAGSLVPTLLSSNLYAILEAGIAAFRMGTTKIMTGNGDSIQFPKVTTHAVATQVSGQGTALAGTDPVFGRMQLDAFKYGELVQVASEVVSDASIDILGFVARDVGRAVSRKIDTDLVVGTGTGQPQGMISAAITGAAGTIATGGSLLTPSYENLVDTVYSVNDQYRQSPACGWLMRDATAGNLRKLRDGAGGTTGAVLWNPSQISGIQFGQPDRLLDFPVYTDPNVASLASNARIIAFGDFSAYYLREIGDFVFERSDDFAFSSDLVTFRGKWRVDGDWIDLTAANLLKQSV